MHFFQTKKDIVPVALIFLWAIYAFCYMMFRQHEATVMYAGVLSFIGQVGLDLTAAILVYLMLKSTSNSVKRKIFILFFISFVFAVIADSSYNIILNILGITAFSNAVDSVFDIPFVGFLMFQFFAWFLVFFKSHMKSNNKLLLKSYIPLVLAGLMIFGIFVFGAQWKIKLLSLVGFYHLLDTIFELLAFIFVMLCLAGSTNRAIRFMSIGYLIIIASDFIIRFSVVIKTLKPGTPLEVTWVLGLMFIVYGLVIMKKDGSYKKENYEWLYPVNSVQSQLTLWSFSLCMSLITIFSMIYYVTTKNIVWSKHIIHDVPSILIVFSVLVALVSLLFARNFYSPIKKLGYLISLYTTEDDSGVFQKKKPIAVSRNLNN